MIDTDDFELVRGSGNVFRDLGRADADLWQLKSILAAEIIGVLDDRELTMTQATAMTGTAPDILAAIRNAGLADVTVDAMMRVLDRLDRRVLVDVTVEDRLGPTADRAA